MIELFAMLAGLSICAAIHEYWVEPSERHPVFVILWVLTGLALFAFSVCAGIGYVSAIAGYVLGDAITDWREMDDGH